MTSLIRRLTRRDDPHANSTIKDHLLPERKSPGLRQRLELITFLLLVNQGLLLLIALLAILDYHDLRIPFLP